MSRQFRRDDDSQGEQPNGNNCSVESGFKVFVNDWQAHRAEAKNAMSKVRDMHGTIAEVVRHTAHLNKLDKLDKLDKLEKLDQLDTIADKLINSATSENKIPLKGHLLSLAINGVFTLIILAILIFQLVKDSGKSFSLGGDSGLHIGDSKK